ncbi:hypothetical protein KIM372_15690 [Bombiscardovia nodaiensis]|uniref:Uncharacterized protein n=1 Tax=Bombiscardovia nodaiensis TaxID=2932181 RepID=A0ABN6SEH8_9BIFI|nr:hypothetical protein KIM372_15690 [Bombiscardovia nodaiensis]
MGIKNARRRGHDNPHGLPEAEPKVHGKLPMEKCGEPAVVYRRIPSPDGRSNIAIVVYATWKRDLSCVISFNAWLYQIQSKLRQSKIRG